MMKVRHLIGGALIGALLLSPEVSAATIEVGVHDRFFSPDRITVGIGDVVVWHNAGTQDPHNIRQDKRLFTSGDPVLSGDYQVTFSSGSFHYFCEVHGGRSVGMDGRVVVPVDVVAAPAGPTFTVTWATHGSSTGSRFDVQYRVGAGDWRQWRKDTLRVKGVFGEGGTPEAVVPGTRYRFRARSQKGTDGRAVSDWSPVASLTP